MVTGNAEFCTQCGRRVEPDAAFCESCGAPVRAHRGGAPAPTPTPASADFADPATAAPSPATRGLRPPVVAGIGAACLLVGLAVGVVLASQHAGRKHAMINTQAETAAAKAGHGGVASLLGGLTGYRAYLVRSQASEGVVLMDGAKVAVVEYYQNNGRFPTSNGEAGIAAAGSITGKYTASVTIGPRPGVIEARFSSGADTAIAGDTLDLVPQASGGAIVWTCNGTVPRSYLPVGCR